MDMARNSIELLEQEIEMTEKKIKLIEKSIETGEKTYESKKQTIERGKSMSEQEFTAFAQQARENRPKSSLVQEYQENRPRSALEVSPPKKVSQFVDKENDNLDSPERFERSYFSHTAKQVSLKVMGK